MTQPHDCRIRLLDPASDAEVNLVADRMRETLVEVVGPEQGRAMYSVEWLRQRVRWHLDPQQTTAALWLAELADGQIAGHTIVRVEPVGSEDPIGLFSTIYVVPQLRRRGIATRLLDRGEQWMVARKLAQAATNTAQANHKLIALLRRRGYDVWLTDDEADMVQLRTTLPDSAR